jgi:hypothetical protein
MSEERRRPGRYRPRGRGGCGCGCASVIVVLTVGLLLSLFNAAIGIGASIRVPFTDSNLTIAGSVGKKENAADVMPGYVHGKLGSNQDFINHSNTLTIWIAEGATLFLVAHQPGAPLIDLHVEAR